MGKIEKKLKEFARKMCLLRVKAHSTPGVYTPGVEVGEEARDEGVKTLIGGRIMGIRKVPLVTGEVYHVYNRSIAGYQIFNSEKDYQRMVEELSFYSMEKPPCKFSLFKELQQRSEPNPCLQADRSKKIVDIIDYCIMPTHPHLTLRQLKEEGISRFMGRILDSYTRYFNIKHNRKGPLWESKFKNVLIKNNDQLLHLSRYIHLNPVSAELVDKPEDWKFSSYREYLGLVKKEERICNYSDVLDMNPASYKKFVDDHIDYQKHLEHIKHLTFE